MTRAILVISFEEDRPERMAEVLEEVRESVKHLPDVTCHGAIGDMARTVLSYFEVVE